MKIYVVISTCIQYLRSSYNTETNFYWAFYLVYLNAK